VLQPLRLLRRHGGVLQPRCVPARVRLLQHHAHLHGHRVSQCLAQPLCIFHPDC
jgi:hypothetical protein